MKTPLVAIAVAAITLAAAAFATVPAVQAATVGEVMFAAGEARIEGATSKLARSAELEVGHTIVTGAGGHVHIKFFDGAFVAVRPNSQLRIDDYIYDSASAANNRVRFTLRAGTSRLITGRAGQANKQGFRLNTPTAAIGIRGTDFVAQVQGEVTRVTVQQGAIVMAPLGVAGCDAGGSDACGGSLARQLTAAQAGSFLEMRGAQAPRLIAPEDARSFKLEGPRSEEPASTTGRPSAEAPPAGFSGTRSVAWGRWQGASDFGANVPPGYEVIGRNEAFVLLRATGVDPTGSNTGIVQFRLADVEAFGRTVGGFYEPAIVSGASLKVDFDKSTYTTAFDWSFKGASHSFVGAGSLSDAGRLLADPLVSNMQMSGGLAAESREAGYVFFRTLPDDVRAYGVTRWER
jgi:hypothetical protein